MNIGIDISQTAYKGTGVARFMSGLTRAILKNSSKHQLTFLFSGLRNSPDPSLVQLIKEHKQRLVTLPIPPSALTIMWNNAHRVKVEKFTGPLDWFISSDWTEPPARAKKATIIHDMIFMKHPETVADSIRKVQADRLKWVSSESSVVFTDSDSTSADVHELLGIPKQKIVRNYPGVDIIEVNTTQVQRTKKKLGINRPYFLAVGKIEPRKNLARLIEAYLALKNPPVDLIIAGPEGWGELEIPKNPRIRFTGFVDDADLAALYASAYAFVFPSLYEGFGFPPVEAMKHMIPVAMSNTSSMKELGKDGAALLFNPLKPKEITKALQTLLDDTDVRSALVVAGAKAAREFTWDAYVKKLISTLTQHS